MAALFICPQCGDEYDAAGTCEICESELAVMEEGFGMDTEEEF